MRVNAKGAIGSLSSIVFPESPPASTGTAAKRGLLLVDDHMVVRAGVRRVLDAIAGEWEISEAADAFEALSCLRRRPFDLAIVDLTMPGMTGLDLIARIRSEFPRVRVLVLSMHAEEQYALRAFKAGASGFVVKDAASAELLKAVQKVVAGGAYVTGALAERVVQRMSGVEPEPLLGSLSDRELQVLRLLVGGQRVRDVAESLHLSVKTISSHKTRIQEKLRLPNTAALIRFGLANQLD
jgi:DNA-binding NarL/FixJ family response regulator